MRTALVLLLLAGCATETKMYGPDGLAYHFIECDGMANPMSTCFKKAERVCPNGYYLADKSSGAGGAGAYGAAIISTGFTKSITVACKT